MEGPLYAGVDVRDVGIMQHYVAIRRYNISICGSAFPGTPGKWQYLWWGGLW